MRWQYWLGRAEIAIRRYRKGNQRLSDILGKRNFYSVAAAKQLGKPIQYLLHQSLKYTAETVKPFSTSLIRIDELITAIKLPPLKVNGAGY
ncbi:hypothetical protein OK016_12420 [Vibrio chagasii]|nr:hypothetical protein [Vibrio chagasii]